MGTMLRPSVCRTCPFKGGFRLRRARREEIHRSVVLDDQRFPCHSEIDYEQEETESDGYTGNARSCAGALTLSTREGHAEQTARIAMRLGEAPVDDPVVPFRTWSEWVAEDDGDEEEEGHTCEVVGTDCECPAGWMGPGGGAIANPDRLEDPDWCSACGSAMCQPCSSGVDGLCVYCEEADREAL